MLVKRLLIALTVLAFAALFMPSAFAAGEAALSQAYAWQQSIDIFITGEMEAGGLDCKVSNQAAEISGSGTLADRGIAVYTTVLIDISASIPSSMRANVRALLHALIDGRGENERFKFATFGESLNVLTDFSGDNDELLAAVSTVAYYDIESIIYDSIYNTIPSVQPIDGEPCYYRTIVITDGVDDARSGVTKEELYVKLQSDTYPIDVVEVSAWRGAEQSKELSALIRMSGGRYFSLSPQSDIDELVNSLATGGVFWLRAVIPAALLDGAVRQVDVTHGDIAVQFDTKIPVYTAPVEEARDPEETPPAETYTSPVETDATEEPTVRVDITPEPPVQMDETESAQEPDPPQIKSVRPELYIGAGAGAVLLIVIVVVVINRKRTPEVPTLDVAGIIAGAVLSERENARVRLRNANDDGQAWDLSLAGEVLIGRGDACQVCITDVSVSRMQCKLYIRGVAMLENLSSSNTTLLNGEPLTRASVIKAGDRLKCGRITLVVDFLS